ncbi:UDP-N-acetylglucosamine 2-epimerase (non-hydrolyzing) [Salmonella enterica]|nr:UDP-N-acetylglucosamine 2-epimerase (non-hydrolyzing) [Salmonella enterica]EDI7863926.1 UDP-N-acetylglucosamine 2-epimerase (non-hydrolyzing) [Salmonella enterica]
MSKKKILIVCGTRPEIIKMAPVFQALQESPCFSPVVIHTGQHTDIASPLYEFFRMMPHHTIDLRRRSGDLACLTGKLLTGLAPVLYQEQPDAVLVHGDTTSSMVAALVACYARVPVGHVEAGLRTYNKFSPYPEEINRCLTGRLADWHYAPTPHAREALLKEGTDSTRIVVTGNTVVDAALQTLRVIQVSGSSPAVLSGRYLTTDRKLILVTAHRRENWGSGLRRIARAVDKLLSQHGDILVVWPLHANPEVAGCVREELSHRVECDNRLILCQPQDYPSLVWLLHHAWIVLTDSGGIQEEAAALGTPVLILRDTTERPELVHAGGGVLVGTETSGIYSAVNHLYRNAELWQGMKNIKNPFGDGQAAKRIVRHLEDVLSGGTEDGVNK